MSCSASVRHVDGIAILDLRGRITLGEGCQMLRDTVYDLVVAGEHLILVNLREVTYIDSAGLGELVSAWSTVSRSRGHVKLLNVQAKVDSLLQIAKLYTVFESFSSESEALASFRTGAAGA